MRLFISIATIFILMFSIAQAEWSGTIAEQLITYEQPPGDGNEVRIVSFCSGNNGELYAVYAQTNSPSPYTRELYFSKSTDGGLTWSGTADDVIINANDGQSVYYSSNYEYVDIDVDSQGRIFIVWSEDYESSGIREIMLLYSTDGGDTWQNSTADVPISNSSGIAYDTGKPAIAIDPNDNLHVIWHQKTDSTYNKYEILYSISTDNGLTWTGQTADREISFRSGETSWNPDIGCDNLGNLYVVWNEMGASEYRLLVGISNDGGVSFSSETADNQAAMEYKETGAASIHIDASNNVHVVYKGSEGDPNYTKLSLYTGTTDGGVTWSGNTALTNVAYDASRDIDSWNTDITSTSDGTLIAVYCASGGSLDLDSIWVSYSTDVGATWSGNTDPDLVSLPDVSSNAHVPYIVTTPDDFLHVIWRQKAVGANREDLFYSNSDTLASSGPDCDYSVGDVNGSGSYNGLDITYGVSYFKGGNSPTIECECPPHGTWYITGDVNGSCTYNGLDITYGVVYFKGGADPFPCPDCPPIG